MDKLKELDLKIETLQKNSKKKTIDENISKELLMKNSNKFIQKIIFSILENIEYQLYFRYIDSDEHQLKIKYIEELYNQYIKENNPSTFVTGLELLQNVKKNKFEYQTSSKKMGDIYVELKKIIKNVSPKNVDECIEFGVDDITQFYKNISKEYKDLIEIYTQFFQPLSCEILQDEKEIEFFNKNLKIQDKKMPYYRIHYSKIKTLYDKIEGLTIIFPNVLNNNLIVVNGIFKKDILGYIQKNELFRDKLKRLEEDLEYIDIPTNFKKLYISQLATRDFIYYTTREIVQTLKSDYDEFITLKNKNLSILVKEFLKSTPEKQRKIITLFLLYDSNTQFSAHIIYDLLTSQNVYMNGIPLYDLLYQTFHWKVQSLFKQTKNIEEETKKKLSTLQNNEIPYDVRITNMNASDYVKSKALDKLKEINGSKDNSVKAQQWLDGLLKIPFGVYKEEKIIKFFNEFQSKLENYVQLISLKVTNFDESYLNAKNKQLYNLLVSLIEKYKKMVIHHSDNEYDNFIEYSRKVLLYYILYIPNLSVDVRFEYNRDMLLELKYQVDYEQQIIKTLEENMEKKEIEKIEIENFSYGNVRLGKERRGSVDFTNDDLLKELNLDHLSEHNKEMIIDMIKNHEFPDENLLEKCIEQLSLIKETKNNICNELIKRDNMEVLKERLEKLETLYVDDEELMYSEENKKEENDYNKKFYGFVVRNFQEIESLVIQWNNFKKSKKEYMKYIDKTLDKCVHGHLESKQQIKRLVGQMMNSKKKKGFCIGLQGPPGVGKTTICLNGLAKCLMDETGESRPIIFIPLGGSSNGSTLEGHNYTYLGSTWGKIADALMESKCMNPIIFIDELDKISKTEHGREISSILTHMTDQTQNSEFFDKYFQSIPLDLSKVIFVFSYNDRNNVDKILLDRIQEIKIKPLSKQDKVIISKNYVLPEIYKNTGFSKDEIHFPSKLLSNIIENYTYEAGVRKLSELLNDIIREINLRRIMGTEYEYPIEIEEELVDEILDDKPKMSYDKILSSPLVGVSYGMYASSVGYGGGISKIQSVFIPSTNKKICIQKATGLAGDMMKESFEVCMSVAYNLMPELIKKELGEREDNGIHIHFNDSSVNKDGPSGGQAITLSLVSLLTNTKVRNNVAITGEINLLGFSMKIGGVYSKINGSIRAGIDTFIIPKENKEDIIQMIRSEQKNNKNLRETYMNNLSPLPMNGLNTIPIQKVSSFLTLDNIKSDEKEEMSEMVGEIVFESCEYEGVEMIYYKNCKVYLVDNIYQVLQIALVDNKIEFKSLF